MIEDSQRGNLSPTKLISKMDLYGYGLLVFSISLLKIHYSSRAAISQTVMTGAINQGIESSKPGLVINLSDV